ncbi:MAG: copper amine oxidase N-terminal domain-containing protein, partial [Tissierellia bacterium]|nr:copper amine oxidase N-terminal domain-containing protein [Tissierellia bacterium]
VEEEFTVEEKAAAIAEIKESRQEFYDFIDEAVLFMESEELEQGTSMFDDSIIKMEMCKQNDSYKQVIDSEIVYENVSMGKLSSITILTPKNVEKVPVTGNTITLEEMEKAYTKAENKVNPVQKVEIQWYADSISTEVIKYRLNGNYDFDFQPYTIIEGRIYLPLRYISESFGEEVDWDNVNKKAYVIRGEQKIDMTGVLVDSKTMVKIRDFDKLGYKIDYVNVDGKSIAIIIK